MKTNLALIVVGLLCGCGEKLQQQKEQPEKLPAQPANQMFVREEATSIGDTYSLLDAKPVTEFEVLIYFGGEVTLDSDAIESTVVVFEKSASFIMPCGQTNYLHKNLDFSRDIPCVCGSTNHFILRWK